MKAIERQRLLDRIEADWARETKGAPKPLDQRTRNRIAGVLMDAGNWEALSELTGVSEKALRYNGTKRKQNDVLLHVNALLRPKSPISVKTFLAWSGDPASPVQAFATWLRDNRREPRIWSRPLQQPDENTPKEPDERMAGIMDFLGRSDLGTVMVVHQAGMTEGLRALAAHIIYRELPNDPELKWRDVCYLPVNRNPESQERITFPKLVGQLHDFFHPRPKGAPAFPPPQDAEKLRTALEEIREAMMVRPAILILDGHNALRGAFPGLRALVSDDALTALLRETLHPLLGHGDTPKDSRRFYENRFLILADHDLPGLSAFQRKASSSQPLPHLPKTRMKPILRSQGRRYSRQLLALYEEKLMRSDSAMALADTVISLRSASSGAPVAGTALRRGLTGPGPAYTALVDILLSGGDRIALFALRMVALSDGGLRETTLVRLVDQWRKLTQGARWSDEFQLPELRFQDVGETMAALRPILLRGADEQMPGLDDLQEPYPYLDEEGRGPSLSPEERLRAFDLRSSELRNSIIEHLVQLPDGPKAMMLMHRLLAEESLRQQTHAMRHAEWRGSADIRYYRRLVQTLFHGFASLAMGPKHIAPMADSAPAVLPQNPSSAYRRLYSVFFRTLLEHPPHFDLSRSLGRDGLKAELLLLAMNADRPPKQLWKSLHSLGAALGPHVPGYLQVDAESAVDLRIAIEQHLSLARATYQTDDLDDALAAQQEAEILLSSPLAEALGADLDEERLRSWKVELDIRIQQAPLEQFDFVDSILKARGFAEIQQDALKALQQCTRAAETPHQAEKTLHDSTNDFVRRHCAGLTATILADWSDLLCRKAEIAVIAADDHRGWERELDRYSAFITFYLAERIRREAFDRQPLGRAFVVNSHSTRVLVRTALQLARAVTQAGVVDEVGRNTLPGRRYFIMLARRHLDLLTRYSARYQSERPSLLILEANFTRSVGGMSTDNLLAALKLLHEADMLMFTTPDRPRVRRRLLLERAKVLRALATAAFNATEDDQPGRHAVAWLKLAILDVVRLWRLISDGQQTDRASTLWERATSEQAEALWEERKERLKRHRIDGLDHEDVATLGNIPPIRPATAA